jgi:ADP-ribose pyrophosphatase
LSQPFKRREIYRGRVLNLGIEEHRMPDGRCSSFEVIRHPGGAAVLPVLPNGDLLLIRQFRPAVGATVWEIPAGRLEEGEEPCECAARELQEEAGYRAASLEMLGGCWSAVGFCDEYLQLFVARQLTVVEQALEPDEVITLEPVALVEALAMVENGEVGDCKTQLALLLYARKMKQKGV